MKRGDVVLGAFSRDFGKLQPAVVIQTDFLNSTHATVVLCPISSTLVDAPAIRITLQPEAGNGLKTPSQIMTDKVMAIRRDKISKTIGRLRRSEISALDRALRTVLDLE